MIDVDEAMIELFADWFAAAAVYGGKWPESNKWVWIDRRLKDMVAEMHPINATLISALLCVFGYEQNAMTALADDPTTKFDWKAAKATIQAHRSPRHVEYLDSLFDLYMSST
jgi:hypothetical protein